MPKHYFLKPKNPSPNHDQTIKQKLDETVLNDAPLLGQDFMCITYQLMVYRRDANTINMHNLSVKARRLTST